MMSGIHAVVFDLDDTIIDTTGTMVGPARQNVAEFLASRLGDHDFSHLVEPSSLRQEDAAADAISRVLEKYGGRCTEAAAVEIQNDLEQFCGPYFAVFQKLASVLGMGEELAEECNEVYDQAPIPDDLSLLPGVRETLEALRAWGLKVFLLTTGTQRRQSEKIRIVGLDQPGLFDHICVAGLRLPQLEDGFRSMLGRFRMRPERVLWVGDRVREEIRLGNELGVLTAQMLRGHYRNVAPRTPFEEPDYRVRSASQIPTLLYLRENGRPPNALHTVAVGGGTGLPVVLDGLSTYCAKPSAVVAVTDTGRSSGVIRDWGLLSPGDIKNVLAALASSLEEQQMLGELMKHRFVDQPSPFRGMSLGNLIIAGLYDTNGKSFKRAISAAAKILHIRGNVYPPTLTNVDVCAELLDGTFRFGELSVREESKSPIVDVFLRERKPDDIVPPVLQNAAGKAVKKSCRDDRLMVDWEAVNAIRQADIVVLGPGCLYTSVIANLAVPEIANAVVRSEALKIYVCNLVTQPGQTDLYTARDHVEAVLHSLEESDPTMTMVPTMELCVVLNTEKPGPADVLAYEQKGQRLIEADDFDLTQEFAGRCRIRTFPCDLLGSAEVLPWEKEPYLRHDPGKVADAICRVYCEHLSKRSDLALSALLS